jgi:hypothetical protein
MKETALSWPEGVHKSQAGGKNKKNFISRFCVLPEILIVFHLLTFLQEHFQFLFYVLLGENI